MTKNTYITENRSEMLQHRTLKGPRVYDKTEVEVITQTMLLGNSDSHTQTIKRFTRKWSKMGTPGPILMQTEKERTRPAVE